MPGGWLKWTFEQYGFNHQVVVVASISPAISRRSTTPSCCPPASGARRSSTGSIRRGTTRPGSGRTASATPGGRSSRSGCETAARSSRSEQLRRNGARAARSADCRRLLPEAGGRRGRGGRGERGGDGTSRADVTRALRETFSSPARLAATLRERVIEPESLFYCPGSLLRERFRSRSPDRLRDAGVLAGVLRIGSGLSAHAVLRHPARSRGALSGAGADPPERLAARRRPACAIRPTSSPSASAAAMSSRSAAQVHFRAAEPRDLQAAVQRALSRAVDAGHGRGAGALSAGAEPRRRASRKTRSARTASS